MKKKLIIALGIAAAIGLFSSQFRSGNTPSSDSTPAQSQNPEGATAGIKLHVTTSNDLAK